MSAILTTRTGERITHESADGTPLPNQPNRHFGHRADWSTFCTMCRRPEAVEREITRLTSAGAVIFACRTGQHGPVVVHTEPGVERDPEAWCCGKTMRRVR